MNRAIAKVIKYRTYFISNYNNAPLLLKKKNLFQKVFFRRCHFFSPKALIKHRVGVDEATED